MHPQQKLSQIARLSAEEKSNPCAMEEVSGHSYDDPKQYSFLYHGKFRMAK